MTRNEFRNALSARLLTLPLSESTKTLDFYDEMICDRVEDGMSEEEAVAALGDIEKLAREILSQYGAVTTGETTYNTSEQANKNHSNADGNQSHSASDMSGTDKNYSSHDTDKIKTENVLLKIIVIILTFPFWLTALLVIISLVITLFSIVWSLVVSLIAVVGSLLISGVIAAGYGVILFFNPAPLRALFTLGVGLSLLGLSLILIPLSVKCAQIAVRISRSIISLFGRFRKK